MDVKHNINQLPWEILEDIFFQLSPFGDLDSVSMVCRLWYRIARSVMLRRQRLFERTLRHYPTIRMSWRRVLCAGWNRPSAPQYNIPAPAPRYLAAVAACKDFVYYFGGITPQFSLFNDFWRFNLSCERWERITAEGDFPSLRGAASLVTFGDDTLILFGGFECQGSFLMQPHPTTVPVVKMHMFTISSKTWTNLRLSPGLQESNYLQTLLSYSVLLMCSNRLFIYGGRNVSDELCNECFVVSLESGEIKTLNLNGSCRPPPRFGHSAVALSDRKMLILGGDLGPNAKKTELGDLWILTGVSDHIGMDTFDSLQWSWTRIKTVEEEIGSSAPNRIFADSAFKVPNTNLIIVLGGANNFVNDCLSRRSMSVKDSDDEDVLLENNEQSKEADPPANSHPSIRLNARANRQRRLAALDRHDPRLRHHVLTPRYRLQTQRQWYIGLNVAGTEDQVPFIHIARRLRYRKMCVYVLDTSQYMDDVNPEDSCKLVPAGDKSFTWLAVDPELQDIACAPDQTHCYAAVLCRQQICLFRGLTVTGSRHPMRFANFREHIFPQAEGSGCVSRYNDVFIWEINKMFPHG